MARFRRSEDSTNEFFDGRHKREHWYRNNSIYFITARCRDRFPAFQTEEAKSVFWDRFAHFINDGRVCLTNNAAERALRGFALGRKSWLFAGSDRGAERAAVMAT